MSRKTEAELQLRQCYEKYRDKIFSYCLARLEGSREAAEDCVQETFLVFNRKLLDGEIFDNPRAFLYRTADNFVRRNKAENAKRAKNEVPLDSIENTVGSSEREIGLFLNIDYDKCAHELLQCLSRDELRLYKMRYIQKMSVESISQVLAVSRPTASMRLLRLRNKVKEMVYHYNFEEKGED